MYKVFFKRLIDIVLSFTGLVVLFMPMACLAVLVRVKLGSPVFFAQDRPGKDEKVFKLYKFRTMKDDCDKDGNPLPDEDRMTGFGNKLRETSMDELPELWNILKGDMSIVGPRPLLCEYLPLYNEEQRHRHDVRPGLTGLAQVNGRNAITWEDKFKYDVEYAKNVSFKLDLNIFFKTISVVLHKDGISSETSVTMEKFTGSK